jgi:hypothetical protein
LKGLFVRKLNPNPFADNFGNLKKVWGFVAEQRQQLFGVQ